MSRSTRERVDRRATLDFDVPVVITDWRRVAENLQPVGVHEVRPQTPGDIALALAKIEEERIPPGSLRSHSLNHYTIDAHLRNLRKALSQIETPKL